ncbi:hypothetical protein D3C78_1652770 [compost metagenome]
MIGFEPGDERIGFAGHLTETHERFHLVRIAAHRLRQRHQTQHIGIGRIGQHRTFAVGDAPQQAVQQRQALRIAMAQAGRGQFHEVARHVRCGGTVG